MSDPWYVLLDTTLDEVWRQLECGLAEATAPARHPALATVASDGAPAMRIVVLRSASREAMQWTVYTDATSAKVAELRAEPRAALLIWDAERRLQTRIASTVTLHIGDAVRPIWEALPPEARALYGGDPSPGTVITNPEAAESVLDPARFAVLDGRIDAIETLHLSRERHRRARFLAHDGFTGEWLAP